MKQWVVLLFCLGGLSSCQPWLSPELSQAPQPVLGHQELALFSAHVMGAKPWRPAGLAVYQDFIYFSDSDNHRVLRFQANSPLKVYAGDGEKGRRNGPLKLARFSRPTGLAFATDGTLFIADTDNHQIRRVSFDGQISTWAGDGQAGYQEGIGTDARFDRPVALTIAPDGRIWVADAGNHRVRQITPDKKVTTIGEMQVPMALDWQAERLVIASLEGVWEWYPQGSPRLRLRADQVGRLSGIKLQPDGHIWATDIYQHRVLFISPDNQIQVIAGQGLSGFTDGDTTKARLSFPWGLVQLTDGQWAIADSGNRSIRRLAYQPKGGTTLQTSRKIGADGFIDQPKEPDQLGRPEALAWWNHQLIAADYTHNRLLTVDPTGKVTKVAAAHADKGVFDKPAGLSSDAKGNLYVSESARHRIQVIPPDGKIRVLAGQIKRGLVNGPGGKALFYLPTALLCDSAGNVYVADTGNHCIRKVTPQGEVTTLAGSGEPGFQDGTGANVKFYYPRGLAWAHDHAILVADSYNHRIRRVTLTGEVSTLAGAGRGGYKEGPRLQAEFYSPHGVATDPQGRLYVADSWNHRIRLISPSGQVSTLVGALASVRIWGLKDTPSGVLADPKALLLHPNGDLYIADTGHERIQRLKVF